MSHGRPIQFTLSTLLVGMLIVASLLGLLVAIGPDNAWYVGEFLFLFWEHSALILACYGLGFVIYLRGKLRPAILLMLIGVGVAIHLARYAISKLLVL